MFKVSFEIRPVNQTLNENIHLLMLVSKRGGGGGSNRRSLAERLRSESE